MICLTPDNYIATINSSFNNLNNFFIPRAPSHAFAQYTPRPIKAQFAPKAKHLNISVPLRIPPSTYTSIFGLPTSFTA